MGLPVFFFVFFFVFYNDTPSTLYYSLRDPNREVGPEVRIVFNNPEPPLPEYYACAYGHSIYPCAARNMGIGYALVFFWM
jgi:hypothetical protein